MDLNLKLLAGAMVAIVVFAGYSAVTAQDSNDYTMIDSTDSIKAGLTVDIVTKSPTGESYQKAIVQSVDGNDVTFNYDSGMKTVSTVYLNYYYPGLAIDFDYTDDSSIPSGVSVDFDGDKTYVINGSYTDPSDTVWSFDQVIIIFDGVDVYNVSGKYTTYMQSAGIEMTTTYLLSTSGEDVILNGEAKITANVTRAKDAFYGQVLRHYDPTTFEEYQTTEKTCRFGGLDVTVYTVNGTYSDVTYKDLDVFVYNNYMLKIDGYEVAEGNAGHTYLITKIYYQDLA